MELALAGVLLAEAKASVALDSGLPEQAPSKNKSKVRDKNTNRCVMVSMQYLGLAGDRLMTGLTLIADAENSEAVMRGLKFEFARNLVLLVFNNLTIKFN